MIKKCSRLSIRMMCRILEVSPSGYYDWKKRKPSKRAAQNTHISSKIREVFDLNKGRYGAIRISKKLRQENIVVGRHKASKLMKLQGLYAKARQKYKATTNSNHKLPVAENLLSKNFQASRVNEKWVSDITYIKTDEGWLYLAAVVDLYSRKTVGWAVSERMTSSLVMSALDMSLKQRKSTKRLILHSDRGSQYCSYEYQNMIRKNNLICSMSKKGDCYDNAPMESWNHTLKVEAIHGNKFKTREEAKRHIFEYIEIYYNRIRLHSAIGYCSPMNFELRNTAS